MAAQCTDCGAKLGFGRRITGKGLCDECERRDKEHRAQAERQRAEARAQYVAIASSAAADGTIGDRLTQLAEQAGLAPAERREAGMESVTNLVAAVVEDEYLTEEEERHLDAVAKRLDLSDEDYLTAVRPFYSRLVIARMAAGRLPELPDAAILLKPKEVAHLQVDARLMKEVVHRETRGGYSGVSIPITKGVRFRTGSYRGKSVVVGTSLQVADEGILCVTSQRAVFKGMRQSAEFAFSKLVGVNVFNDGIQFHVSNRKLAPLFRVADGYLVAAAVNAVVQREHD